MLHGESRTGCYIANGEKNVTWRMPNRMLHSVI